MEGQLHWCFRVERERGDGEVDNTCCGLPQAQRYQPAVPLSSGLRRIRRRKARNAMFSNHLKKPEITAKTVLEYLPANDPI